MAIDPGTRRIGLAITDSMRILASPLGVIQIKLGEDPVPKIVEAVRQQQPAIVVVGNPIGLDGEETEKSRQSQALIEKLRIQLPEIQWKLWDERLSTVMASELLHDAGKNTRKQKSVIDAAAAAVILQSFMEYLEMNGEK